MNDREATLGIPFRGAMREVRSPHDGSVVGTAEQVDAEGMRMALDAVVATARGKHVPPPWERAAILRRTAERVRGAREAFALRIAREGGKPLIDARIEIDRAAGGLEELAALATSVVGEEIPMKAGPQCEGRLAFTTLEPIGVSASISAFNHPLNLAVHQIGPAVAAGCPFLHKPAIETPLSAIALVAALRESGLPVACGMVVPCDVAVAEPLATSDRIGHLSFIGSAKVGWHLRSAIAPGVRIALEHGGAAPLIVDRGVDLERVVAAIAKGGYYHAGQVCVSTQRVFVHEGIAPELTDRLVAAAKKLRVGDPSSAEIDVGPLLRDADVERVAAWIAEAVAAGAKLATGGERVGPRHLSPAVLVGAPPSSKVMTEEVFGPVVCVSPVASLDEAIARANEVRWSFQAAIFTNDLASAMRAARELDAATVLVNDHTAFRIDSMPFGGRGASGLGVGGLSYSVHELLQPKLVVLRA
jgi:acyl-CoA reductase-like NAD-dependent aldehyde dehydrogenase